MEPSGLPPEHPAPPLERRYFQDRRVFRAAALAADVGLSFLVFRRIKGCNLACWKSDALSVGSFDETFTGWGYEDADFVFRLQDKGIIRRAGTWATEVLHIWHKPADPSRATTNQKVVLDRIEAARLRKKAA
ncbi:galactosyltransferase-related protein [Mesorhizobium tamadayense]|uniref:galactosyltransferase-related protein n=1 Tax=Mesorhizobium tamadayense TaxID=425306 RepID=UPI003CCAC327